MNDGMTYLATPFMHPDPLVQERRFLVINHVASEMMRRGEHVFSPISHCFPIAKAGGLPRDWEFWQHYCRLTLSNCTRMLVIKQPGWEESVGVKNETKIAQELGIPVAYQDPPIIPDIELKFPITVGQVLELVEEEEEFPGDMPQALKDEFSKGDVEFAVKKMRQAVQITKNGIRTRIKKEFT